MAQISQFAFGPVTPVLAYGLAALSIGGTAVWGLHVIAMLGFRIDGVEIRFDLRTTLLSAVVAVVFVGAGLFIVGSSGVALWRSWAVASSPGSDSRACTTWESSR